MFLTGLIDGHKVNTQANSLCVLKRTEIINQFSKTNVNHKNQIIHEIFRCIITKNGLPEAFVL